MRNRLNGTSAVLLVGMLCLGACGSASDSVGPDGKLLPPSPFRVSNPVAAIASAGLLQSGSASGGANGIAYVSLAAGSLPGGTSVSIHDRVINAELVAPVVDGGLDPVAIVANPGDTLDLVVTLSNGEPPLAFAQAVPAESPPVVVRTDPRPGKRDVPLNAIIVIVFSEPVDTSTITGSTIQLKLGSLDIPGTVQVTGADYLMAVFQPDAPLVPNTGYQLVVTSGVADLDGESLLTPPTVSFTTGDAGTPPAPSGQIAFSAAGGDGVSHIYLLDLQGFAVKQLTSGADPDYSPAWSPDHSKIAFSRGGATASAGIWTMGVDGTGAERRSALVGAPAWSPDGSTLAIMPGNATWLVSASGALAEQQILGPLPGMVLYRQPSWSPDGTTISFEGTIDVVGWFTQVYLMDADGTDVRRLTSSCSYGPCGSQSAEGSPAWSPTGNQLAFWSYDFGITTSGATGLGLASVTHDGVLKTGSEPSAGINAHPSWSSDGQWLVFQSPWPNGQLVIRRADGSGQPVAVTNLPGGAASPAW